MRKWTIVILAAALSSAPAAAWNDRGHMVVAAKAWRHLTPQTKNRVGQLLRHNPRYASWTSGIPQSQKARVAFTRAATWPDFIKFAHGYENDGLPNANSRRNIGYADCLQHRYWHFKDLPFSPDGTPTDDPPEPNAETQIEAFAATLADASAGDEVKSYDLAWLIHMVGDIHQPLHATQRFVASDTFSGGHGDRGANDVKYCLSSRCTQGQPLHSFWDGALGNDRDLGSIATLAAQLPAPPAAQANNLVVATWFPESFELAKAEVYKPPIGVDISHPFVLTSSYRADTAETATAQVSLAGVRLAGLLNGAHIQVRGDAVRPHSCPSGV
jgi:S1/P1 nuclease